MTKFKKNLIREPQTISDVAQLLTTFDRPSFGLEISRKNVRNSNQNEKQSKNQEKVDK